MSIEWGEPARYLTDDRDLEERNDLVIMPGGNGDWYIGVCPEGEYPVNKMVRLCTSGGAASNCPELTRAASRMYRALIGEEIEEADPLKVFKLELENEQLKAEIAEMRKWIKK